MAEARGPWPVLPFGRRVPRLHPLEDAHARPDAVRTDFHSRRDLEKPRRGRADASVFGREGLRDRLAPDECRALCGGRRGPRVHGVDQGRAARLRHDRRPRPVGRRVHSGPEALRRLHPAAQRGARHPARPFGAQGAALPPVGGRRAAQALARDRRLGRLGACLIERDQCARHRSDAAHADARRNPASDRALGAGGAARARGGLRRARYSWRARLPDPSVPLAVLERAQRRVRRQRIEPHALRDRGGGERARALARHRSRCSCACRCRTMPAGGRTRAWRSRSW